MSGSVPFAVQRIDHVVLRARDSGRLIGFYRDVLGCPVERQAGELGLTQLRAGASLIDIVSADGPLGRAGGAAPGLPGVDRAPNMDHVCLRVEPFEADAITRHLQCCGVAPSALRRVYGAEGIGPSIYLADPEGNTVELKGPADTQRPAEDNA